MGDGWLFSRDDLAAMKLTEWRNKINEIKVWNQRNKVNKINETSRIKKKRTKNKSKNYYKIREKIENDKKPMKTETKLEEKEKMDV
jgi:hypothetical protein